VTADVLEDLKAGCWKHEIISIEGRPRERVSNPRNPENTWTGRGRMPRWLVAATKGGKAKREDFLA